MHRTVVSHRTRGSGNKHRYRSLVLQVLITLSKSTARIMLALPCRELELTTARSEVTRPSLEPYQQGTCCGARQWPTDLRSILLGAAQPTIPLQHDTLQRVCKCGYCICKLGSIERQLETYAAHALIRMRRAAPVHHYEPTNLSIPQNGTSVAVGFAGASASTICQEHM